MSSQPNDFLERFSLVVGGPFHTVLRRAGLVEADLLSSHRTAFGLALLAWLIPVSLASIQALLDDGYIGLSIFSDLTVYSRYLVAVWVMIATERVADARISLLVRQFPHARLVGEAGLPRFAAAVARADRRSSSKLAEAIILILVLIWSVTVTRFLSAVSVKSWEGAVIDGTVVLSWAGEAAAWLSTPFFLFLVFRWVWRFVVWAALLRSIARLPLQLMPLHPDRAGGLGFLSIFPSVFGGLVFALSCVVASALDKAFVFLEHTQQTIWLAMGAWMVLILVLFLGPLLAFSRPLYLAREHALLDYGRLAQQHHLAFHRKWIEPADAGDELMGSSDPSSVSDLNASVEAVLTMRTFPLDRPALVRLLLTAGIPFLAVAASQMPLNDLLMLILGTIL
ncbi:MAG TPA: hypothetical protein VI566_08195 [Xanthomonadales bacterium]|nr:hypothetical protein [Xanthomonadales bacterium]